MRRIVATLYFLAAVHACPCGENEFCFQDSCQTCPPHSSSKSGSVSMEECLCGPGYQPHHKLDGQTNTFWCLPCMPGTFKSQPGNSRCMHCPSQMLSPAGSTNESDCDLAYQLVSSDDNNDKRQKLTPRHFEHNPSSFSQSNELRGGFATQTNSTLCCPGSFLSETSFITGDGLKIFDNTAAASYYSLPFRRLYSKFRISSDGKFAIAATVCYDGNYCPSPIYKVDMTTFEDVVIAGTGNYTNVWTDAIDGPGTIATFTPMAFGDIAIAPDGSYALIADSYTARIRKIDLRTLDVSTLASGNVLGLGIDIASDGSFAIFTDFYGVHKLDLSSNMLTFLIPASNYPFFIRLTPDATVAVFFSLYEYVIYKVLINDASVVVLAGNGPNPPGNYDYSGSFGFLDGIGTSAQFGYMNALAISATGDHALVMEYQHMRRIDLSTGQVQTVLSGKFVPGLDSFGVWSLCPAGSFSTSGLATSCQTCSPGTFQNQAGQTSCHSNASSLPELPLSNLTWPCPPPPRETCCSRILSPNTAIAVTLPSGAALTSITVFPVDPTEMAGTPFATTPPLGDLSSMMAVTISVAGPQGLRETSCTTFLLLAPLADTHRPGFRPFGLHCGPAPQDPASSAPLAARARVVVSPEVDLAGFHLGYSVCSMRPSTVAGAAFLGGWALPNATIWLPVPPST